MKKDYVFGALVLLVCVALSSATVIVQDDFNAGPLDTSKWTSEGNISFVNERGVDGVSLNTVNWSSAFLWSNTTVSLAAGETAVMTITDFDGHDYQKGHTMGFISSDWSSMVAVSIEDGGVVAYIKANGGERQSRIIWGDERHFEGPMVITMSADYVTIDGGYDGDYWASYGLDTRTQTDGNGNAWVMPTLGTDMKVALVSGYSNNSLFVDSVTAEIVPEPATMVLLGLGSLIALKRRK